LINDGRSFSFDGRSEGGVGLSGGVGSRSGFGNGGVGSHSGLLSGGFGSRSGRLSSGGDGGLFESLSGLPGP